MILAGKYPSSVDRLVVWGCNASVTEQDLELYEAIRDTSKWNPKMKEPLEGNEKKCVYKYSSVCHQLKSIV